MLCLFSIKLAARLFIFSRSVITNNHIFNEHSQVLLHLPAYSKNQPIAKSWFEDLKKEFFQFCK
jgi:hypothetical protein